MAFRSVTVTVTARPYVFSYADGNCPLVLTATEAQRIIDGCRYSIVSARRDRVVMSNSSGVGMTIQPATLGGGPAFEITRGVR